MSNEGGDCVPKEIGRLNVSDLVEGQVISLPIPGNADELEILLVKSSGTINAWINSCPHDGRPLCRDPNYVWDSSGRYLECMNHQATFDPNTGMCTDGPCVGDSLLGVKIHQEGGQIVLSL